MSKHQRNKNQDRKQAPSDCDEDACLLPLPQGGIQYHTIDQDLTLEELAYKGSSSYCHNRRVLKVSIVQDDSWVYLLRWATAVSHSFMPDIRGIQGTLTIIVANHKHDQSEAHRQEEGESKRLKIGCPRDIISFLRLFRLEYFGQ